RLDICRAGSSAELAKLLHHDPAALDFVQAKTCGHFFGGFCTGVPGVLSGARGQTFGAVEQAPWPRPCDCHPPGLPPRPARRAAVTSPRNTIYPFLSYFLGYFLAEFPQQTVERKP